MMAAAAQTGHGPLSGLRVLDFTALAPGPIAGLMLAEAGAEVIKIEPTGGEAMRSPPPSWGDLSAVFALLNRGKRSLALDLKDASARERLRPLIASADVLLEGFRPGVMARLGLSVDAVRQTNPRLVYCSITGYGQDGPKAQRPGHDLSYIAETGLLALSAGPAGQPTVPPVLIADLMGGSYPAVMAVLMALLRRERTGEGAHIDIAMTQGLFLPMFWAWSQGLSGAGWPGSGDHTFTGASPRYRLYPCADGGLLAVGALEDKFWAAFCAAIGLPEAMSADEAAPGAVIAAVAERIAASPAAHWREIFARTACCVSVVENLEAALGDPHFAGLTAGRQVSLGSRALPALPMPFASLLGREDAPRRAPVLGEANAEFGFPALPADQLAAMP
jgi:crotonobetainyl-CoA:carnitine CoA-transferase CaiB-like acyl-CoA transferase